MTNRKLVLSTTAPLATLPPRRRDRSATVESPEIAVETLHDISRELAPLFVRFWKESGKHDVPLDPDWEALLRLTALGFLRIVTVRNGDILVGFILNVVNQPHLMYRSTPHGTTIAYWLSPEFRAGWFPIKLFRRNVELLREWGCRRIFIAADSGYKDGRMGHVFERLGYKPHETTYAMVP